MFKSLPESTPGLVDIYINGQKKPVAAGISVAAAVLGHHIEYSRTTPVSGAKRLPFCMMGVCYDCLMVIDGVANQRACCCTVHDGMRIDSQEKTGPELTLKGPANE